MENLSLCNYTECENLVPKLRGCSPPTEFCKFHICKFKGCRKAIKGNSLGCREHQCEIDHCPDIIRRDYRNQTRYCSRHLCREWWCSMGTLWEATHCQKHSCPVEGCFRALKCPEHACRSGQCTQPKLLGSNYCQEHQCIYTDCKQEVAQLDPLPFINWANKDQRIESTACTEHAKLLLKSATKYAK